MRHLDWDDVQTIHDEMRALTVDEQEIVQPLLDGGERRRAAAEKLQILTDRELGRIEHFLEIAASRSLHGAYDALARVDEAKAEREEETR